VSNYIHTIGPEHDGQRIDNFIIGRLPGVPRGRIYRAFRSGEVRLNGGRVKPSGRLAEGDEVRVPPLRVSEKPELLIPDWMKKQVKQAIIHETDVIKVLNKPAGTPVHVGTGVAGGVIETIAHLEDDPYWQLVHRLDRQTSGCLLVARQGKVLRALSNQFRERSVQKVYLAVVSGRWEHGAITIDKPLEKHVLEGGERMVTVSPDGVSAVTRVEPLWVSDGYSLLEIQLGTGRTHQIRVHLADAGHPVLGDQKYADKRDSRRWKKAYGDSLFLHAVCLRFSLDDEPWEARASVSSSWRSLAVWPEIKEMGLVSVTNACNLLDSNDSH